MYSIWDRIKSTIVELFQRRLLVMIIVFCILFTVLAGRCFQLQIVDGQSYLDDYRLQIQKQERYREQEEISMTGTVSFWLTTSWPIP